MLWLQEQKNQFISLLLSVHQKRKDLAAEKRKSGSLSPKSPKQEYGTVSWPKLLTQLQKSAIEIENTGWGEGGVGNDTFHQKFTVFVL